VDTTGAGDAFCGGFMAMYTLTSDLYNAGLAGAVSASFAVEDFGLSHMFDVTPKQALNRFIELSGK
jgi:ribokinase